jgi:hypothetical protein
MLKFPYEEAILRSAKDLIKDGESIDLAVAYWGVSAVEKLGITGDRPTRIVCDLMSGGCNPREISVLLKEKNVTVRHLHGLHTKVYWSPKRAMVGSANASANGLGEGGTGTIEAGIETDDPAVLKEISGWFESVWERSKKITDQMVHDAKEAWLRQRPKPTPTATVLSMLQTDPEWFRESVWVTYYNTPASDLAKSKFEKIKKDYYSPRELQRFEKGELPLYDLSREDVTEEMIGDYVLDMGDKTPYELMEVVPYSRKNSLVLLKPRNDVWGLLFPATERSSLRREIKRHMARNGLNDFARKLHELPQEIKAALVAS